MFKRPPLCGLLTFGATTFHLRLPFILTLLTIALSARGQALVGDISFIQRVLPNSAHIGTPTSYAYDRIDSTRIWSQKRVILSYNADGLISRIAYLYPPSIDTLYIDSIYYTPSKRQRLYVALARYSGTPTFFRTAITAYTYEPNDTLKSRKVWSIPSNGIPQLSNQNFRSLYSQFDAQGRRIQRVDTLIDGLGRKYPGIWYTFTYAGSSRYPTGYSVDDWSNNDRHTIAYTNIHWQDTTRLWMDTATYMRADSGLPAAYGTVSGHVIPDGFYQCIQSTNGGYCTTRTYNSEGDPVQYFPDDTSRRYTYVYQRAAGLISEIKGFYRTHSRDHPFDRTTYFGNTVLTRLSADRPCQLAIYPNPASDQIQISGLRQGCLRILDCQGKTIFQAQVHDSSTELNIEGFPAGLYQVMFDDEARQRLVIQ